MTYAIFSNLRSFKFILQFRGLGTNKLHRLSLSHRPRSVLSLSCIPVLSFYSYRFFLTWLPVGCSGIVLERLACRELRMQLPTSWIMEVFTVFRTVERKALNMLSVLVFLWMWEWNNVVYLKVFMCSVRRNCSVAFLESTVFSRQL